MNYAPEGYKFFHVSTPSVFAELLLPTYAEERTRKEQKEYDRLEDLAGLHGTYVGSSYYRLG